MTTFRELAEKTAASVDPAILSFDPISLIAFFIKVLPILTSCWTSVVNDTASPDDIDKTALARLRGANKRNREGLVKKTARRIRAEADEPMTKQDSFILAKAAIDQALTIDESSASKLCAAANSMWAV